MMNPEPVEKIKRSMSVNDLIRGGKTTKQALEIKMTATKVGEATLELNEWHSNIRDLEVESMTSDGESQGYVRRQLDVKQLCQHEIINKVIFEDILARRREGDLKSLEQVRKIYLHPEMFSIENGLLTPTFKAKRSEIHNTFKDKIERLYEEVEAGN
ncbi:long-chain-fatty-acid--CoA ligase 5-like [Stylophora pistillata]|uniref:long-chain-fatty-acid--CoA ligase 5-like n=1 Tax=Stylophora pistillata TaxID=50429 RepID=UPI000C04E2E2|nr:long-chain-fatty-acid--CoA ligase 5-like [Stylophora pistillata]